MCETTSASKNGLSWMSQDGSKFMLMTTDAVHQKYTQHRSCLQSGSINIWKTNFHNNNNDKKSTCCESFVCLELMLPPLCTLLHGRCHSSLLHWPNAFGLLQLSQGLVPLCELLGQQEHLEEQKSGVSGWSSVSNVCNKYSSSGKPSMQGNNIEFRLNMS